MKVIWIVIIRISITIKMKNVDKNYPIHTTSITVTLLPLLPPSIPYSHTISNTSSPPTGPSLHGWLAFSTSPSNSTFSTFLTLTPLCVVVPIKHTLSLSLSLSLSLRHTHTLSLSTIPLKHSDSNSPEWWSYWPLSHHWGACGDQKCWKYGPPWLQP